MLLVVAGEDDPKACTGRRLERRGLARRVRSVEDVRPPPVVLDPFAAVPLAPSDRRAAERGGLLVVDCSWNRLRERGRFPGSGPRAAMRPPRRRLPYLVATNPQHYGRLAQLNTVEALSAGLYLLGHEVEAHHLTEGFRGGAQFLTVNGTRLAAYRAGQDADGVRAAERRLFGGEP